jgi:hypothetical protein
MARPKGWPTVTLAIPPGIFALTQKHAEGKGVPVDEHLLALVFAAAEGRTAANSEKRLGRPPLPVPPAVPDDVERSENETGFAGVYRYRSRYRAFYGKDELIGVFGSAEDAAIARYWYHRGKAASAVLDVRDPVVRDSMLRSMGGVPLLTFGRGDLVDYDPIIGAPPGRRGVRVAEGPITTDEGAIFWRLDGFELPVAHADLTAHQPEAD